jgi:uncharacterized protein YukE
MALPGNWNASTVDVDPMVLHDSAATMTTAAQGILNDLTDIITALNSLKVSWVGDSADAATAATDRWNNTMTLLYGTEDDPSTGILNILTGGLASDAVNYSQCEQQVYDMFNTFESTLVAATKGGDGSDNGDGKDDPPPTDITDAPYPVSPTPYYHTTSVNEKF